jgi:hypothetical protein
MDYGLEIERRVLEYCKKRTYIPKEFAEKRIIPLYEKAEILFGPFGESVVTNAKHIVADLLADCARCGFSGVEKVQVTLKTPRYLVSNSQYELDGREIKKFLRETATAGYDLGSQMRKRKTPIKYLEDVMKWVVKLTGGDFEGYEEIISKDSNISKVLSQKGQK